jgi:hypothetical protein
LLLALRLDRLDQLVEALRERLDALLDELARRLVHAHALRLDLADRLARPVHVAVERALERPVVEERLDRVERHRVHRLRADELLHVEHVAVVGVLRARAGPQAALHVAPACRRSANSSPPKMRPNDSYASFALAIAARPRASSAAARVELSSFPSTFVSTRLTKKLATLAMREMSCPASRRAAGRRCRRAPRARTPRR